MFACISMYNTVITLLICLIEMSDVARTSAGFFNTVLIVTQI